MPTAYQVKTKIFEGPMHLLLELVENRKLFVNEVSLSEVTDEYLKHVRGLSGPSLSSRAGMEYADMTSFLLVAATLILIKSRSLLPNLTLSEEEKKDIGSLETRVRLYALVQKIGEIIKEKFGQEIIFSREEFRNEEVVFAPDASLSIAKLHEALNGVIAAIPKKEILPEIEVKKVISIEEMLENLTKRIEEGMKLSFSTFSGHGFSLGAPKTKEEKVVLIVSFLAMLELVRQGIMDALQHANFQEIEMMKNNYE